MKAIVLVAAALAGASAAPQALKVESDQLLQEFAGRYTNVIVGDDGLALVAFNDEKAGGVKAVHCEDPKCTGVTKQTVDPTGNANNARFLMLRKAPKSGLPVMSYAEQTGNAGVLKVVTCLDSACRKYNKTQPVNGSVSYSALAFPSGADLPAVAFTDDALGLRAVFATARGFTGPVTVDHGKYPSLMFAGPKGDIPIMFYCASQGAVRYLRCIDQLCDPEVGYATASIDVPSGGAAKYSAATLTSPSTWAGIFVDEDAGTLLFVNCSVDATPTGGAGKCSHPIVVDHIGNNPYGVFPEIDAFPSYSPYPVISYFDTVSSTAGRLRFAACESHACTSPTLQTLAEGAAGDGRDSSMAVLPSSNLFFVSYLEYNGGRNKHARLIVASSQ